jgi:two-component system, chemotaxis family, protein-glutamate methylesterase/glutaminase
VDSVVEPATRLPASVADAVVVAGASAGGVEALIAFVGSLPAPTRHAVCVVLHVSPAGTSVMADILRRSSRMPVHSAADGEALLAGHVYVAPPDHHLEVEPGRIRLTQAPRENGHRPAIDTTMRTAAVSYGGAAVGVILSGSRDDGTAGLRAIKSRGGFTVVQEPAEALYRGMPESAIAHVEIDAVLPIADMAGWLAALKPSGPPAKPTPDPLQPPMQEQGIPLTAEPPREDAAGTRFTCPDCGGVLFEQKEHGLTRFRCSVGHVYSLEALADEQSRHIEGALWPAVRVLEDRRELLGRMARRAGRDGDHRSAQSFVDEAAALDRRAAVIRDAILASRPAIVADESEAAS